MEKKRLQRIVGTLVVVSLIVIMLPLLFGKNEITAQETTNVKAPPFPDQQSTVATSTSTVNPAAPTTTDTAEANPTVVVTPELANSINEASNNATHVMTPLTEVQAAAPVTSTANPLPDTHVEAVPAAVAEQTPAMAENTVKAMDDEPVADTAKTEKPIATKKKLARVIAVEHAAKSANSNKLKSSGWVVQMGSFNVKENAQKLTKKLRSAGYNAFVRNVKSSKGAGSLRVYVGPELKQASAVKLSNQLQKNLSLHGFVVEYKPLEL